MTKQKARKTTNRDIEIGFRIKQKRQSKNLSQSYVADKCGVGYQQIQKYESGKNRLSAERIEQIADILGCTVDDLLHPAGKNDFRKLPEAANKVDIDAVAANLWNGLKSPRHKQAIVNLMESLHDSTPVQPPGTVKRDL